MTIFVGSRYENETPFLLKDPRTQQVRETVLSTRTLNSDTAFRYHLWSETDRVDRLAEKYFGDAESWWYIMDANPEILNVLDIRPGDLIRIPNA